MSRLDAMIPARRGHTSWFRIVWLLPAMLLALGAAPAIPNGPATTYTVNSTTDEPNATLGSAVCDSTPSHVCTLRAAIMAANNNPGSTVVIHNGLFRLTIGGSDDTAQAGDLDVTQNLTLVGDGAGVTIVDGSLLSPTDRLFDIRPGANVTMSGLTIQHGKAPDNGGAIRVGDPAAAEATSLTLSNCSLLDNQAGPPGRGGAVYSARPENQVTISNCAITSNSTSFGGAIDNRGTLTLANSTVTSNTVDTAGGGLENESGTVFITGSTFSGDSSFNGGAIENVGGTLTISGSTFHDNTGGQGAGILNNATLVMSQTGLIHNVSNDSTGGGLLNQPSGRATLSNVAVISNSAHIYGGGLYNSGVLTLTDGLIGNNSAAIVAGGGLVEDGGTALVADSAIFSNSAPSGGGIFVASGAITVTNSTVSGNTAGDGAGVYNNDASAIVDLANDTVAYNLAGQLFGAGGISGTIAIKNTLIAWNAYQGISFPVYISDCRGNVTSGGYNLVRVDDCGFSHQTGDQVGTFGSPLNPLIGPLANNGGPSTPAGVPPTHALLPGSPAIDAGNPAGCRDPSGVLLTTDQRGLPRPANVGNGLKCDIGAYELEPADLSVGQRDSRDPAPLGAPLTYTVTVTNAGPDLATGVTLTDTVPAGATFDGVAASQGNCLGAVEVICHLGALASGAHLTVTLTVTPTAAGTIHNVAAVSASEFDPVLANNTTNEATTVVRQVFLPLVTRSP